MGQDLLNPRRRHAALLRANRVSGHVWAWALLAGGLGIVALVVALRLANRLVVLPEQKLPDLSQVPKVTVLSLLVMAAPVAGMVEEAAFRGDDVRRRSSRLHLDPLAVLPGRNGRRRRAPAR